MEYTFILAQAADATAEASTQTATQPTGDSVVITNEGVAAGTAPAPAPSSSNSWIILIVLFAAMYFFLIAPQRKREKLRRKMLSETKVGDNVITIGGICGTITNKSDKTYILKVSDTAKIEVLISAVHQNLTQEEANSVAKK